MKRLQEIDSLRGIAVALMLIYHFIFDAWFMGIWDLNLKMALIDFTGYFVRFVFLGLVGVSVFLSSRNFFGQLKRSVRILAGAMLITLVTFFLVPDYTIWFGILHLIAVSIPILYFFKNRPFGALFFAGLILFVSVFIPKPFDGADFLLIFGAYPAGFNSIDYFPLFPWLSVPLIGLFLAHLFYDRLKIRPLRFLESVPILPFLGKHAFAIYMIHQPIFIAVLTLGIKLNLV